MFTRLVCVASLLAPFAVAGGVAEGAAVVFPAASGGTGSSYEVILNDDLDHAGAAGAATAAGGHLVSITSAAEQSFVESLLVNTGAPTGSYWMGLERLDADNFAWNTGEAFGYQNFAGGEPNFFNGQEVFGQIYWSQDINDDIHSRRGGWNDVPLPGYAEADIVDLIRTGLIIERDGVGETPSGGGDPPPVAIPLPPALLAAPLAFALAGLAGRRARKTA